MIEIGMHYAQDDRPKKGKSLLIFPASFVAVDIETTGLDPTFDSIIELAAVKYENGIEVSSFETLVNPQTEIPDYITELTGITGDMLRAAPLLSDVLPQFQDFFGEMVMVGHNVHFDANFLYEKAEELGIAPLQNDRVDTLRLARRLLPGLVSHRLDSVADACGVELKSHHRAGEDCRAAAQILTKLESLYKNGSWEADPFSSKRHGFKAADIKSENEDFDEDSPIYGRSFVFTGELSGLSRRQAMQEVVNRGGTCLDSLTKKTNYLVMGGFDNIRNVGEGGSKKMKKAREYKLKGCDIEVISEKLFLEMLSSDAKSE